MLAFSIFVKGEAPAEFDLTGAYLVGSDDVALRGEITYRKGLVTCKKRTAGPAGLCLPWTLETGQRIMLETARLIERDRPYVLQVELLRGRLTRISQKLEDWGFLDNDDGQPFMERFDRCRDKLVDALQAASTDDAARVADVALADSIRLSEELTRFHADLFLERRRHGGPLGRRVFGCFIDPEQTSDGYRKLLTSAFDFSALPCWWRTVEPAEQKFNWKPIDACVEWAAKNRLPLRGTPLLSFSERNLPDWLYIYEHDFETIRDLAHEHVKRVVVRYAQYVACWDVASGLHAENGLSCSFEQLMELTRMSAATVKQIAPRAACIVDVVAPWGEYYAGNTRTIPPMLYAEMVVQAGVNFDAFGLRFEFGVPGPDGTPRDLFQVSALLDRFASFGKPLHITAVQVPSGGPGPGGGAGGGGNGGGAGKSADARRGGAWDEAAQAEWLEAVCVIALSRPAVESVCFAALADGSGQAIPTGGLVRRDLTPKPAYDRLRKLRAKLAAGR